MLQVGVRVGVCSFGGEVVGGCCRVSTPVLQYAKIVVQAKERFEQGGVRVGFFC